MVNVNLHGRFTNEQKLCDLEVGESLCYQIVNLSFARRETRLEAKRGLTLIASGNSKIVVSYLS